MKFVTGLLAAALLLGGVKASHAAVRIADDRGGRIGTYIGSGANPPRRASRPIEHPGRNLQRSPGCPTREAATENLSASLLNHLLNMDQASGPRMRRIK
jgi:hypothetical protein